jgi:carbonic anhydrase
VLDEHSPVPPGTHLDALVNAIRPALEQSRHMPGDLVDNAVWVQVGMTVRSITNLPLLADPIQHKRLLVVGAVYNLETGNVELAMS